MNKKRVSEDTLRRITAYPMMNTVMQNLLVTLTPLTMIDLNRIYDYINLKIESVNPIAGELIQPMTPGQS